jgi:hypothetical protein
VVRVSVVVWRASTLAAPARQTAHRCLMSTRGLAVRKRSLDHVSIWTMPDVKRNSTFSRSSDEASTVGVHKGIASPTARLCMKAYMVCLSPCRNVI